MAIKIAQNAPSQRSPNVDTEYLAKKAHAEVSIVNEKKKKINWQLYFK